MQNTRINVIISTNTNINGGIDMKKIIIAGIVAGSMLFGSVAGATVTSLMNEKEALKHVYKEKFEQFNEDFTLGDLAVYEEGKVVKLDAEAKEYFETKKEEYKKKKYEQVDKDYEQAHKEVMNEIDNLFK